MAPSIRPVANTLGTVDGRIVKVFVALNIQCKNYDFVGMGVKNGNNFSRGIGFNVQPAPFACICVGPYGN